ncbi:MAG TPA: response regulator transcription factor [Cellvibrio sp.]|nr:response regulator transcription factor [Cellvibrio sp.]
MRLLLVEDDLMLGEALQDALMPHSYVVDWVKDGESALKSLRREHFEIIILDIGLPGMDGFEVLKKLRSENFEVPVLLLTARDSLTDKVTGLDAGADDYLLKPFDLDELLARLRALSRRAAGRAIPFINHGKLCINPENQSVSYDNQPIVLARREYMVLIKLLENTGRVLSREQLEQSLYGWLDDVDSNALEVHIHHIRKKIPVDLIRTVRGVGYTINKWNESQT